MSSVPQVYLDTYFVAEFTSECFPARFGIITAYNPNGRSATDAENLEADLKLQRCLQQQGLPYFRVTGLSKDKRHQEPGFGIITEDRRLLETLTQDFEQEAFFWVEDGDVYCVKTGAPTAHWVGRWPERQLSTKRSTWLG